MIDDTLVNVLLPRRPPGTACSVANRKRGYGIRPFVQNLTRLQFHSFTLCAISMACAQLVGAF
eukprot:scaffold618470_cov23-Prasinocladus_malaysianus.AAC.1